MRLEKGLRWCVEGAALGMVGLASLASAYSSSVFAGDDLATMAAWALGVVGFGFAVVLLLLPRTRGSLTVVALAGLLLIVCLVLGTTTTIVRLRLARIDTDLRALCDGLLQDEPREEVTADPVAFTRSMPVQAGSSSVVGAWAFRSPSGAPSCYFQLSTSTGRTAGLVLSPGGQPAYTQVGLGYREIADDWYTWSLGYGYHLGGERRGPHVASANAPPDPQGSRSRSVSVV